VAHQSCSHVVESAEQEPLSDEEKSDLESSGGSEFNSDEDFDQGIGLESDAEDELLGERVEQELLEIAGEDLSIDDKDILRAFAYKIKSHLTEANFNMLQFAFPSANVPSLKKAKSRVAFLSGLEPQYHDCCVNSCCCFVGPNEDLEVCPHCSAPRYQSNGRPHKQFTYVPVIPRLVSMFQNPALATKMKYRAHDHIHTP
ncbi:hypothetical protein P692DRAFT_20667152, partial [Suillus brevipes Sb2]